MRRLKSAPLFRLAAPHMRRLKSAPPPRSEFQPQSELPRARRRQPVEAGNPACRSGTIHTSAVPSRVCKVHVVREVERLGAELRLEPFSDREALEERHVPLRERRAEQSVAAHVAERASRRATPRAINLAVGR